jgi:hypothetical protein
MSKHFAAAFTQHVTRFSSKASAHRRVFTVDGEITRGPYGSRTGSLSDLFEPAIRIDRLGNSRQHRECWAGYPWRLIATGARLVGPLVVGVRKIRLGELRDLRERPWPMHEAPTPEALER